ncbi:uroporphyrinogen-III synthase [Shewanella avicenniae]|uniref:Uroporphyrinogen-III synthase n=1 Tax=Shewanella avicenniae TaxID=2814294 RepID=A0ABX7QRH8_9GAMM|nr:uroporphyrinogen-III synthase [Shewanella avicenniae]QSX34062.1 uroporphyrinogen-III synthase [Shewanella avicenniae]
MKILLTRPDGRNQSMAESLTEQGIPFLVTPLLAVSALPQPSTALLESADILIFISTNAVQYLTCSADVLSANCQVYAVGDATLHALQKRDIKAFGTPADNQQTEGLLTLAGLQPDAVTHKNIVIVRGVGGRETLAEQLSSFGAKVSYYEVYRRHCPEYDRLAIINEWQQFGIDTIMLTSGEALTNLISLTSEENFSWLQACHIIVPSIRVQQQAHEAGLSFVVNAGAANDAAMLKALSL